ncbi:MAG: response regulator [Planctomycetaceae bacterium]|nr:response regulator [Planctomycetaceae bacterium]
MRPATGPTATEDCSQAGVEKRLSYRPLNGLRVLVVDDDRIPRKIVANAVASAGGEPLEAEDGAVGLAMFNSAPGSVDAVVVDYLMPGLDGVDLVRLVRTLGFAGPIIGVSGTASEAQILAWVEAGCDEVLEKGFSTTELITELAAAHRRRSRRSALRNSSRK